MQLKPCPTELPQSINPEAGPKRAGVETHRNLNCHHYDNCLDEAVRRYQEANGLTGEGLKN